MPYCPENNTDCLEPCSGPIRLKTETVGSLSGNSTHVIYDVTKVIVESVCRVEAINKVIPKTDWVYDLANVTGREFSNSPEELLPQRILTITEY